MRTLVVSDLHLGSRLDRDVLRRPAAQAALLDALGGIDRLVLLGDVIELAEQRDEIAIAVTEPVLRAIGARMGPDREILLVPGNHDRALVRPWLLRERERVAVDQVVPPDATPLLARLVSWLAPAPVRVHYPGVWLGDGVFATHGHYLDRHLLPESAFGVTRGRLRRGSAETVAPYEYERIRRTPSASRIEALLARWLPRPLAIVVEDLAEVLRVSTMPHVARRRGGYHLAPLTSRLLGVQMQRASVPALARVVRRLGVDPEVVIFGHVHRRGPVKGDDAELWTGPGGRPRIVNTGAWTYEALLLHGAGPPHPYWPGGAVLVETGAEPRSIGLLDGLDAETLARP
ncbi:hypothetical protein FSW04_18335 [Baekduia soli]|uniref:Calcineurin-like phosphoesterase domain-containing protein n=1 Tax=Baekduia soli TaxID=496014 RepID=A0A5B8U8M3_9ACTN|nr:metallophosphoesterase [Baekduia soli]QEC49340.1 hypothetical protein FSW04_18335 [Baekduia soli]